MGQERIIKRNKQQTCNNVVSELVGEGKLFHVMFFNIYFLLLIPLFNSKSHR